MNDEEERGFQQRFASLENASRSLSADVISLNQTLQAVADLQRRQREQTKRQEAADAEIAENKLQIAQAAQESNVRNAHTRAVLWLITMLLAIVLPLVSILVYLSLINHVDHLLTSQQSTFYAGCLLRNKATLENADREERVAKLEATPELRAVHAESAAKLRATVIDCNRYRTTK